MFINKIGIFQKANDNETKKFRNFKYPKLYNYRHFKTRILKIPKWVNSRNEEIPNNFKL